MKRPTRMAPAAGLALALGLGLTIPVAPVHAASSEDATALAQAFSECSQRRGQADVILLLDQSLSLVDSDPDMVRRDASRDLARQLATYAEAANVDVRMQVAGFDGRYNGGQWRSLGSGSVGTILDEIDSVADNEGLGSATDYWMALDGARTQFAKSASSRSGCQFLLWFSDGQYDVDENGVYGREVPYAPGTTLTAGTKDEVISAGKESICSPKQGPMNPMRATGVFVATVGLNAGNVDLGFLQKATDGSNSCGRSPQQAHAAYLEADEAGALTLAIAGLSGGTLGEASYDGRNATLDFGLDEAVSRASVLAYSGPLSGETDFGLSGPDDQVVWWEPSGPAEQQVSGAAVTFERVTDQAGRFTIVRPEDAENWSGRWTVHLRAASELPPEAKAQMVVTVTGDLRAEWSDPVDKAAVREELPVTVSLTTGSDEPFTTDHPGVRLAIDYVDAQGTVTELKSGLRVPDLATPQSVVLPDSPGQGRLSLRVDLTTDTDPPTQVAPVVTAYELPLAVPGDYPTVDAPRFASVEGPDPSAGIVPVTGPGCVWIDPVKTDDAVQSLPDGMESVTVEADAAARKSCVQLAQGETRELRVTLKPSAQGNGSIVGDLSIWAAPDGDGADTEFVRPYAAERSKQASQQTKWLALILITLAGLVLGAAPLFLVRARLARIQVRDPRYGPLQMAVRRFRLQDGRMTDENGGSFELTAADIHNASPGGATHVRNLEVAGLSISARTVGNPFTTPDTVVTRTGGPVVTSQTGAAGAAGSAALPLALPGQWVAWPEPTGGYAGVFFLGSHEVWDSELATTSRALAERIESAAAILETTAGSSVPAGAHSGGPTAPAAPTGAPGASWDTSKPGADTGGTNDDPPGGWASGSDGWRSGDDRDPSAPPDHW